MLFFLCFGVAGEAIFDVAFQVEIQFMRRERVVSRQHRVDFVEVGFVVGVSRSRASRCRRVVGCVSAHAMLRGTGRVLSEWAEGARGF